MIEVKDLRKLFGTKAAVDGVSFKVNKGEVLGFLGPNGAGKSTTMRMITGYFPPTSGQVSIGGVDVLTSPVKAKSLFGYLPENAPLYPDMTVLGFLNFCAELRGLSGKAKKTAIDRALEICFLQPVRNQSVDTLSKGYRHRTCMAQSIVHDPEVLILDEPTDGLDPNQKHVVRNMIKEMGRTKAIVFSTHILEEVEAACTRAIIIDRGRIVADGTPDELKRRAPGADAIRLVIRNSVEAGDLEKIAGVEKVQTVTKDEGRFVGLLHPAKGADASQIALEVNRLAAVKQWQVEDLHREEGRLDEVFRAITRSDVNL